MKGDMDSYIGHDHGYVEPPRPPCSSCRGKGVRPAICKSCRGRGSFLVDDPRHPYTCPSCRGKGVRPEVCSTCRGSGRGPRPQRSCA